SALRDLYGEPSRFAETMRSLLWTHAGLLLPSFIGSTEVHLPLPCSYDFTLAAAKFLYALDHGEVPLLLLFSGTVFHRTPSNELQVAQVSTACETAFRLPLEVWQRTMEHYYPNWAPLALRKDVFDRLYRYKQRRELRTWE